MDLPIWIACTVRHGYFVGGKVGDLVDKDFLSGWKLDAEADSNLHAISLQEIFVDIPTGHDCADECAPDGKIVGKTHLSSLDIVALAATGERVRDEGWRSE